MRTAAEASPRPRSQRHGNEEAPTQALEDDDRERCIIWLTKCRGRGTRYIVAEIMTFSVEPHRRTTVILIYVADEPMIVVDKKKSENRLILRSA